MDDQGQNIGLQCWYSPSGVERRGSKAMLRAAGHEDAGYLPRESHRVQSPTSGAWHPCECSRGSDHLGDQQAGDDADNVRAVLAILAARGHDVTDPVILTLPRGWFDTDRDPMLVPWPLPHRTICRLEKPNVEGRSAGLRW